MLAVVLKLPVIVSPEANKILLLGAYLRILRPWSFVVSDITVPVAPDVPPVNVSPTVHVPLEPDILNALPASAGSCIPAAGNGLSGNCSAVPKRRPSNIV